MLDQSSLPPQSETKASLASQPPRCSLLGTSLRAAPTLFTLGSHHTLWPSLHLKLNGYLNSPATWTLDTPQRTAKVDKKKMLN